MLREFSKVTGISIYSASRGYDSPSFKISSFEDVYKVLEQNKFDYVFNCIGRLNFASNSPVLLNDDFIKVNAEFPIRVSHLISETNSNCRLIHISTDAVFLTDNSPKTELTIPNAISIYGHSKALGENLKSNSLIIRAALLGKGPKSLYERIRKSPSGTSFTAYPNQNWNGISDYALARYLLSYVLREDNAVGIRHAIPSDLITKHDLLKFLFKKTKRSDLLKTTSIDLTAGNSSLQTLFPEWNELNWINTGFKSVPTVLDTLAEL